MLVTTIKKLWNSPEKIIFGLERAGLLDWLNDESYLKMLYRITFRRKLDLDHPVAYTEKIAWYKLHWRNNLAKMCVDKLTVREYVSKKIGPQYLIECYGSWNSFEEIDFQKLPDQFVLKPTNGSGDAVICRDKNKLDLIKARKQLYHYSKRHFSTKTKEWAYYGLPFRIMAERLIKHPGRTAIYDYKFFCFYGEPEFLYVGTDRDTKVKFSFYDLDWNFIPVRNAHDYDSNLLKPEHFNEMLQIAEKLSEDFPQVRVDLYEEEGKVYFGELTFYHCGGFARFEPDDWDYEFGRMFDLSNIPQNQIR